MEENGPEIIIAFCNPAIEAFLMPEETMRQAGVDEGQRRYPGRIFSTNPNAKNDEPQFLMRIAAQV